MVQMSSLYADFTGTCFDSYLKFSMMRLPFMCSCLVMVDNLFKSSS